MATASPANLPPLRGCRCDTDLTSRHGRASREVTIAELWLRKTYVQATLIAHQVWGGMGYALEGNLFLWSQRAKTIDLVCGQRASRLEQLLAS